MGDGSGTSNGGSNSFPPVGAPDRYDMIVQRGRALRRRRRYTLGAGAGGTVVALAVAVVLVTNGGPEDPTITELADKGTTTTEAIVSADEGATTTTSTVPMPDVMTVTIDSATSMVLVQDPTQPVHDDSKQCVYLQLTDPAGNFVAEGSGCNTGTGPVEVPLNPPGVEINAGCTLDRYDPAELAALPTGEASSSFVYRLDPTIPGGEYALTGTAVSGLTDGCADTDDTTFERENVAEGKTTIELP